MSEQDKAARERAAQRDNQQPPRFYTTAARPAASEAASASAASAANTPHTHSHAAPHHHHHHHHHHHSHPSGSSTSSTGMSDRPPPSATSSAHEASRVPGSGLSSAYPLRHGESSSTAGAASSRPSLLGPRTGSPFTIPSYMNEKRERDRLREIDRERELARERQQKGPSGGGTTDTSPGRSTAPTPFRSMLSTSPTLSTRPPNPGGVGAAGPKPPSASHQPPPPATSSSRPGGPLPSFSSLSRPLGSAYDSGHQRSGSASSMSAQDKAGHQRTLSTSSQPSSESLGGLSTIGQTSPVKTNNPPPSAASRGIFGGPPPLSQASRDAASQRSPVQHTTSVTSPTQASRDPVSASSSASKPASSTSGGTRPPYSFSSTYASAYTQPYSSYGLGGSFLSGSSTYPFSYTQQERERREREQREREKEREQQREKERERVREQDRERERLARERDAKDREEQQLRAERERERRATYGTETTAKPFQPPRQTSTAYADMYRPRPPGAPYNEPKYTRHIEVINRPEPQAYAAEPAKPPQPVTATSNAPPPPMPRTAAAAPPPAGDNRAYSYTPKTAEPAREYTYTPREKRPRMDTAVEEAASQRRAGGGRQKRKKEEEVVPKKPQRDWSVLTSDVKRWPEVNSIILENWLKPHPLLTKVAGHETYGGSDWSLAKSPCVNPANEGSMVMVRVAGAFLGKNWKVRGEPGWDEASSWGGDGAVIGLGWGPDGKARKDRKIWGTDVYTDDSDIGLILVHAGWIRWGSTPGRDDDTLLVTVRIVPTLVRYTATERNGVTSRGWGNSHDGISIAVEDVERIKVEKDYLARIPKRARAKVRMAEMNRQRAAMDALAPLPADLLTAAGVLGEDHAPGTVAPVTTRVGPHLQMTCDEGEVWYPYRGVDDLAGWLNPPNHDSGAHYSIWSHDLEFASNNERYYFQLFIDNGRPVIDVEYIHPVILRRTNEVEKQEPLVQELSPRKIVLFDHGALLQTGEESGTFINIHKWHWVRRALGPLTPPWFAKEGNKVEEIQTGMVVDPVI